MTEALWVSGSLRSGVSPPGNGSSGSGSPWRRHEVKPAAVWKFNVCIFIKSSKMSTTDQRMTTQIMASMFANCSTSTQCSMGSIHFTCKNVVSSLLYLFHYYIVYLNDEVYCIFNNGDCSTVYNVQLYSDHLE